MVAEQSAAQRGAASRRRTPSRRPRGAKRRSRIR
jgi:hypothetical protein